MSRYFRNSPVSEPFTFDSVGNHWSQESVSRPNGYPLYHYLQTEKGCGRIFIQGEKYTLTEGEGVMISPYTRHSYAKKTEEWTTLFATFSGTLESSIPKILGNRPVIFTNPEQGCLIASLISDVIHKCENQLSDIPSSTVDCYRLLMSFADKVSTSVLMQDPLYQRYIAPTIKEMETKYDTPLTVQQLSSLVYITPQYLTRLYGRFMGCSVYEYLTAYRISRAKEFLLVNHRMEIQQIAQRVGYLDASHFIATFKKMTGMTPLEFRKLN